MMELEKALLDELERLQDEILRLQDVIESKQNENKELSKAYESLRKERTTLYYDDLAIKFKQNLESILSAHNLELEKSENNLESLENEQKEIEQTKAALNKLLQTYSTTDYSKLERDYKTLQADYIALENAYKGLQDELSTIKTKLQESLTDMQAGFQTAYDELNQQLLDEMAESLENAWQAKLKALLPIVDLKLNENYKNPNANE